MIKLVAFALFGTLAAASTATLRSPADLSPQAVHHDTVPADERREIPGLESLVVYYSPLRSTEVARFVGFGLAHHMAIVYTDRFGMSHGASSGPSDLGAPQNASNAWGALVALADGTPSAFGLLVSDPRNGTPFVRNSPDDVYTKDADGRRYPYAVAVQGRDLSASWTSILETYQRVGSEKLTYSPLNQNSNSLAGTALRRVGLEPAFSKTSVFAPGAFTMLPLRQPRDARSS